MGNYHGNFESEKENQNKAIEEKIRFFLVYQLKVCLVKCFDLKTNYLNVTLSGTGNSECVS